MKSSDRVGLHWSTKMRSFATSVRPLATTNTSTPDVTRWRVVLMSVVLSGSSRTWKAKPRGRSPRSARPAARTGPGRLRSRNAHSLCAIVHLSRSRGAHAPAEPEVLGYSLHARQCRDVSGTYGARRENARADAPRPAPGAQAPGTGW